MTTLFFFFFFFAFHFWKRRKFVLGLPKWEFCTGKKHFTPGKKSGKITLPPQKNMPVTPLVMMWVQAKAYAVPFDKTLYLMRYGRNSNIMELSRLFIQHRSWCYCCWEADIALEARYILSQHFQCTICACGFNTSTYILAGKVYKTKHAHLAWF